VNKKEAVPMSGDEVDLVKVTLGEPPVPSTGDVPAASAYVEYPVVFASASEFSMKFNKEDPPDPLPPITCHLESLLL